MGPGEADFREDETCRRFVVPALTWAGWSADQVLDEYPITAGKIQAAARFFERGHPLRADYALEYTPGFVIGIVEAKRTRRNAGDGIEQAKRYATLLDVPFAYATNGILIYEIDLATGLITQRAGFPTPAELWERYRAAKGITDGLDSELTSTAFNEDLRNWDNSPKVPRYYQRIAVNRTLHEIAAGRDRILLVLATGTGKTMVAFQVVAKLWRSSWTGGRHPRVLYLADRNVLIDQPKDEYFSQVFGDAVWKLGGGEAKRGRNIYFALYQSLEQGDEQALFEAFPRDHFDLIIVDECHRGSAAEASRWRRILDHYAPAVQIGMTATPISDADRDTFGYFGNPVYTYSLAQGIEDGFLAPYRVRKVGLNVDLSGWRPEPGQRDIFGRDIPDELYGPRDYERVLAILDRTEQAAVSITEILIRAEEPGRMGKTIVFCENNDHANRMRIALNNANADLVQQYPSYVFRITDDDGPAGRASLDEFKRLDTDEPVIAVTSRLLTTGVDLPAVRNIVLFRRIGSAPEFKQIVGRGTRVAEGIGKFTFDIIDFVDATRLFNDPAFDGPPLRVIREEVDADGRLIESDEQDAGQDAAEPSEDGDEMVREPESGYESQDGGTADNGGSGETGGADGDDAARIRARAPRLYVDGVEVFVWGEGFYVADSRSGRLRLVEYRQYVRDRLLTLNLSAEDLRGQWAQSRSRAELSRLLREQGIEIRELAERLGNPEADPLDLMLNLAWQLPVLSRAERARRVRLNHGAFLDSFTPEARQVLEAILEKYAAYGIDEVSPTVLRVPPFTAMGSPSELAARFGDSQRMREALDALGQHIYDVA
jgi:type I restriction enzyme R subunit